MNAQSTSRHILYDSLYYHLYEGEFLVDSVTRSFVVPSAYNRLMLLWVKLRCPWNHVVNYLDYVQPNRQRNPYKDTNPQ